VLIDRFLPRWDVREHHEIKIQTAPEEAFQAIMNLDLGRSRIIRILFAARGLSGKKSMTLEGLTAVGFVVLGDDPPTELVLGLVGKFWRMRGGLRKVGAEDFVSFVDPGLVKAARNFRVEQADGGSSVSTETRVLATDASAQRSFRLYWFFVGPFSALIRRQAHHLIGNRSNPLGWENPACCDYQVQREQDQPNAWPDVSRATKRARPIPINATTPPSTTVDIGTTTPSPLPKATNPSRIGMTIADAIPTFLDSVTLPYSQTRP